MGDYTMYSLPGDVAQASINDIVFDAGAVWVGTKKGLIKIKGSQFTVYRQFSNWPFEWIKHLIVTPYGLVVNTLVAEHNYGGKHAGSYLFDIKNETWLRLGRNNRAQAWLDGYLYQVSTKLIRRDPLHSWQKQIVLSDLCTRWTSSVVMRAINGELWLSGDSLRRYSTGCGVIRYNPEKGKSIVYKSQDGVNGDMGVDIGGDSRDVYIAHSMRSGHLSRFDLHARSWQSLRAGGTGYRIAVTARAIWLACLNPAQPLLRIDRDSAETTRLPGLGKKEYVSAVGENDKDVWFGTYVQNWQGQGYTIESRLGRYTHLH